MTSTPDHRAPDGYIDGALSRLPVWEPPGDFAQRLAAAAARQAQRPRESAPVAAFGVAMERITGFTLALLAGLTSAALVLWLVPWSAVVSEPAVLVWGCALLFGGCGLWLARRALLGALRIWALPP